MSWPAGAAAASCELTDGRAKPAVYFGGMSRIIDFALSNALNSGIRRIGVATQYKAHSLIRDMQRAWNFLRPERNESFDILPASQRIDEFHWYEGTADAVFQNIDIIAAHDPKYIVILAGDHIYKMDYELMLQQHVRQGADVTVGCLEVPLAQATGFGVMAIDDEGRITDFVEKPSDPPAMPGKAEMALASMGIYVFNTQFLFDQLRRDADTPDSKRDFGNDIIPYIVKHGKAVAHLFSSSCIRAAEEIGECGAMSGRSTPIGKPTIDLTDVVPKLNMYDRDWPIWTDQIIAAPAKFVHDEEGRRGQRHLIAHLAGLHRVGRTGLPQPALHRRQDGQLFERQRGSDPALLQYRPGARLNRVIVDSGVRIPEGLVVGEDPELDARRFRRTESGICLITKPMIDRLG